MIEASCLCGQVSFQVDAVVASARYCHCQKCRKFSGTGSSAWGLTQLAGLTILSGTDRLRKYDSGGGNRVFCECCGSPLWYEPFEYPDYLGLPLGVVDTGEVEPPAIHVWTRFSPGWESIAPDLPQLEDGGGH